MKLRHLRAFVAVAETGSFVGAARELNQVQAALSKQVAALELELGSRLFVRGPREVVLTDAGQALLPEARGLLELSDQAVWSTRAAADRPAGTLRLAYAELHQPHELLLASILADFGTRHPQVAVVSRRMSSAEQWHALRERTLQVGIGYGEPPEPEGLAHEPLVTICLSGVVLPRDHPLAGQEPLRFRDLAGLPLILFPREVNPPLHDWLLGGLDERGLRPRLRPWMHSHTAHEAAVRAGHGWMLASDALAAPAEGLVMRRVDDPPLATSLSLWWVRDQPDPAVRALVDAARSALAPAAEAGVAAAAGG